MKYLCLLFLVTFSSVSSVVADDKFDYLITGGLVFDGSGSEGQSIVIGITGDRIVYVGAAKAGLAAAKHINASGLIASPGFIDPHTHAYQERPLISGSPTQYVRNRPIILIHTATCNSLWLRFHGSSLSMRLIE